MLIDTHCHLDLDLFDADREAVIARAAATGVIGIIVPALDLASSAGILGLAERHDGIYVAVGVHPNSSAGWDEAWLDQLRQLAGHEKVVAIGEIGLDYYWDRSPPETQQRAFAAQLALAASLELPVIVHNREASDDVLAIIAASPLVGRARPGVLHSFSAGPATAARAVELGFYLGFTGPLTYKSAAELRQVAATTPLDRLLVETDAPFLPPQARRGRRNEPAYVAFVNERLATLHNIPAEEMARITTANAVRLFALPDHRS